jgi:peptide chain release factor 1
VDECRRAPVHIFYDLKVNDPKGHELFEQLQKVLDRYEEITAAMGTQEVATNPGKIRALSTEQSGMEELVQTYRSYRDVRKDLDEAEQILSVSDDEELKEMANLELDDLRSQEEDLANQLKILIVPKDPNDAKDTLVEIRAGAGGDEAALFASDLYRMYAKFAEAIGAKVETLSSHATGIGGFKEIIFSVSGRDIFSHLKFESGVHRVQRVPETESSGRIHTSTATVAVLPEAEEVDVAIDPNDLKIDVYRSSGPGGQSVNTTDSAVRITHLPSGIVVQIQDEKSQHKNRAKALKVLRSRLLDLAIQEQHAKESANRKQQVGSGDRSAKIRTYNYPQGRVTDHRIKVTLHRLEEILGGDLHELIDQLRVADQAEKLATQEAVPS